MGGDGGEAAVPVKIVRSGWVVDDQRRSAHGRAAEELVGGKRLSFESSSTVEVKMVGCSVVI